MTRALVRFAGYFVEKRYSVLDAVVLLLVAWFAWTDGGWFASVLFLIWIALVGEIETRIALKRSRRFRRP